MPSHHPNHHVAIAIRIALTMAVITVQAAGAVSSELTERFLTEYPPAARHIEEVYSRIKMQSEVTMQYGEVTVEEHRTYMVKDGSVRRDTKRTRNTQPGYAEDAVTVQTPALSFRLAKNSNSSGGRFVIGQLGGGSPIVGASRLSARAPFIPTSFFEFRIVDFIKEPGFAFGNAREEIRESRKTAVLEWKAPLTNRKRWGEFAFDLPSWVLVGSKLNLQGPGVLKDNPDGHTLIETVIQYAEAIDGVPIVKAIELYSSARKASTETMTPRNKYEVENITHFSQQDIAPEDFSLASFGIDMNSVPRRRSPLYWLVAVGIACLALFVAWWYRSRRHVAT